MASLPFECFELLFQGKNHFFKDSGIFFNDLIKRGTTSVIGKYVKVVQKASFFFPCNNGLFSVPIFCGWIPTQDLVPVPPEVSKGFFWRSGVAGCYWFWVLLVPFTYKLAARQSGVLSGDPQDKRVWHCHEQVAAGARRRFAVQAASTPANLSWSCSSPHRWKSHSAVEVKEVSGARGRAGEQLRRGTVAALYGKGKGHFPR